MIVVADSSPLIAMGRIGRLEILHAVFGQLLVPDAVWHPTINYLTPLLSPNFDVDPIERGLGGARTLNQCLKSAFSGIRTDSAREELELCLAM